MKFFSQELKTIVEDNLSINILGQKSREVTPQQYQDNEGRIRFILKDYNLKDLELLSIASWFLSPITGSLIRADIEERVQATVDKKARERISLYLKSPIVCLDYLLDISPMSAHSWYGNKKDRLIELLSSLKCKTWRLSTKPVQRYTGYCRGYPSSRPRARREKQIIINDKIDALRRITLETEREISKLHELSMGLYINRNFSESKEISNKIKDLRNLRDWANSWLEQYYRQ